MDKILTVFNFTMLGVLFFVLAYTLWVLLQDRRSLGKEDTSNMKGADE